MLKGIPDTLQPFLFFRTKFDLHAILQQLYFGD